MEIIVCVFKISLSLKWLKDSQVEDGNCGSASRVGVVVVVVHEEKWYWGRSFLNKERIVVRKVKWSQWIRNLLREWFRRKPCKWEARFLAKFVWWDFSVEYASPLCSWLLWLPLVPFSLVPFHFQPCQWLIHQGIQLFLTISVSQFPSPLFDLEHFLFIFLCFTEVGLWMQCHLPLLSYNYCFADIEHCLFQKLWNWVVKICRI